MGTATRSLTGSAQNAILFVAGLLFAVNDAGDLAAEEILFKHNFSDLPSKWEVVDDPEAACSSQWRVGIAELSGIHNEDEYHEEVATMLLAGEDSSENYCVETSLFSAGADGYLTGLIFGLQDAKRFYHVGYNFDERRFELKCRTGNRFKTLAHRKLTFPEHTEIPIQLVFAGSWIRFTANRHVVFDLEDGTYQKGRFGLGTADLGSAKVLIGPVTVRSIDPSKLPPPVENQVRKLSAKPAGDQSEQAPTGAILFHDDLSGGDLGKWQVWDNSETEPKHSMWRIVASDFSGTSTAPDKAATHLLVGEKDWKNYVVKTNLFSAGADGCLSGIVLGYQDHEHFYHAGYNFSTDRFELEVRTPQGFEMLSFAEMELPHQGSIPLELTFTGERILFKANGRTVFDIDNEHCAAGRAGIATSGLDDGCVAFHGFEVLSCDPANLPSREIQDLLSFRRGAAVIYRTSPPVDDPCAQLLDHSLTDKEEMGDTYDLDLAEVTLPEEAVFGFPQGRFVEIHRLGFKLDDEDYPKQIKFWVSDQTPKSGFTPLATIELKREPESYQEFAVGPVTAKYLKFQVTEGHGSDSISIPEMFVRGYFKEPGIRLGAKDSLGTADLKEQEPNDSMDTAQSLPLDVCLEAQAAEDDVDYYHISSAGESGDTLVVDLQHIGVLRPECTLLTRDGSEIEPVQTRLLPGGSSAEYSVAPGGYYLRVVRPETYLTIVYDDSASMEKSVPIVKRVLRGYLGSLGSRLNVKLVEYSDEPTDLCDFTHDPEELKAAIKGEVGGGGGTDTFAGLMQAINSVKDKEGNRAVLAMFDVIDAADDPLKQYIELWDSILDAGISFSSIGVQSGWDERTEFFGNSRQRIFREIAYASQGEFHHTPSEALVERSANTIFEQLTGPTRYSVRAHWKTRARQPGWIQVAFGEGTGTETARNVELILDASYSMWGKMGGTNKISVARQVLKQVIQKLPDNIHVGLRVFGHRYHRQDRRTNTDTELKFPIGPMDKSRLIETINRIGPKGKTPLVYSILQAQSEFRKTRKGTLVVVTDGLETCGGDINSIAPALKRSGLELRVNIVGFGIKELSARKQLEAIAESTGGRYLDASNPRELLASLEETLHVEFVVVDQEGTEQARGFVGGQAVKVLEGHHTLRLLLEPEPLEVRVVVEPEKTCAFVFEKAKGRWTARPD